MIGETLAHFRVVEKLGEGGMGEVFPHLPLSAELTEESVRAADGVSCTVCHQIGAGGGISVYSIAPSIVPNISRNLIQDNSGTETIWASIGQIFYLDDRKVSLDQTAQQHRGDGILEQDRPQQFRPQGE